MNIVDIDSLPGGQSPVEPSKLLTKDQHEYLEPFIDGVKAIHFAVHQKKTTVSVC